MKVMHPDSSGWFRRRLSATAATFPARKIGWTAAALWLVLMAPLGRAEDAPKVATSSSDWSDLSLEQLINIQVTSVSKKQTDLFKSPAAIYVITQEDIRRSGLNSIPELLRMVPGLDVARQDANHWAISSRGFNYVYANKLLVLIDGRSVYTPATAGVFWNVQDTALEDIERIEVIRGPGATLWGANAVNGVINIITKSAQDTQGGLVSAVYGTEEQPTATIRYGGTLATNLFYRVYVKNFNRDDFVDSTGKDTADEWNATRGGFRLDWEASDINRLTLQGDYYRSDAGETVDEAALTPPFVNRGNFVDHNQGRNVLGRWTHDFSDVSQLSLQLYYDHSEEGNAPILIKNDTYDFDLQHRFALGTRQDIVWGVGYRYLTQDATRSFVESFTPSVVHQQSFSAFIQDDITLVRDRLHFTLGSKFEHNDLTGFEIEPSARLLWTPTKQQTVWAAVSRAVRTPSLFERNSRYNAAAFQPPFSPPILVSLFGNPDLTSEKMIAYELGYRIEPAKRLSFDAAAFYNVYKDLTFLVSNPNQFEVNPAPPHVLISQTWQNANAGETYGAELSAQWQVTDHWRLTGSYTWLHMHTHLQDASGENSSPQQQFQIRSYLDLPHHLELNGAIYYVDQIRPQSGEANVQVSAYVRLDLGVVWRPTKSLEIGIWGQNLLEDQHAEFASVTTALRTEVPRSVLGKITWWF